MRLIQFVKKVSGEAVVEGVQQIKRYHLPHQRIISARNPLVRNGSDAIWHHGDARNSYRIPSKKISQFLAASSLSHLLDGWMYLSDAFCALLNGDKGTAVHLAYYAELRSAMSFLATEGLGVFSDKHIGIFSATQSDVYPTNYYKSPGNPTSYKQPKSPTHQFVWEAVEKWSQTSTRPNIELLKIFKVDGHNFYDLMEYFHPSTASSSLVTVKIVKKWLKDWCFDIKNYRLDRQNRNEASYRPQRISNYSENIDFALIINELTRFWEIISPSENSEFDALDKYLLKKLFSSVYDGLGTTQTLYELVSTAFQQHGMYDSQLINFMTSNSSEHPIFTYASMRSNEPLAIFARATLLLRISMGLVSQLFSKGQITKNNLNFIWTKYSLDNGFWPPEEPVENFKDLWYDISSLLEDLKVDISNQANNSLFSLRERKPLEIMFLSQINRACLWGLDF